MKRRISKPAEFIKGVPIAVWLLALVAIPLLFTFVMSFYSSSGLVIDTTLTLKNYKLFFTDSLYPRILFKSIRLAVANSPGTVPP